jgi:hypothetical protein
MRFLESSTDWTFGIQMKSTSVKSYVSMMRLFEPFKLSSSIGTKITCGLPTISIEARSANRSECLHN